MEEDEVEGKKKNSVLKKEVLLLVTKIIVIVVVFVIIFNFIFGISRYGDNSMIPAIHNGDIVLYYRLDTDCIARDTVVVEYEGELQIRRVVAIAGDTVDFSESGLLINGSLQSELNIYMETLPYTDGYNFPVTLGEDEVFLLGDNRKDATDSRIYGPVNTRDILGKVIGIFRRRGI